MKTTKTKFMGKNSGCHVVEGIVGALGDICIVVGFQTN